MHAKTAKFPFRILMWLILGLGTTLAAGCSPQIDHRGYLAKPGTFGQVAEGMSKTEVESILGSPSTTASVNMQGDSYYYITSVTETRAFLTPREVNREVIAIRFDGADQVQSVAQYTLEDGRVINMSSRQTPVEGTELSVIQDLFRGILRVKPGTSARPSKT